MQAFADMPSAKFVLRYAIASGYCKKIVSIGKWDNNCTALLNRFISETGFQQQMVDYVFKSVACALGWIECVSLCENSDVSAPIMKPDSKSSNDEWENYLNKFVEWKPNSQYPDLKGEGGVVVNGKGSISIYVSLEGECNKSVQSYATICDANGHIRKKVWVGYSDKIHGYVCHEEESIRISVEKIGKVIIWVETD